MLKSKVFAGALAGALLAGLAPVQAMVGAAPPPVPALDAGTRAQLAAEAGITPAEAAGLSLTQLSEMKNHHDGDDGAYWGLGIVPPKPAPHS